MSVRIRFRAAIWSRMFPGASKSLAVAIEIDAHEIEHVQHERQQRASEKDEWGEEIERAAGDG